MANQYTRPYDVSPDLILSLSVVSPNGCWNWTGPVNATNGYGRLGISNKRYSAHRLSWMAFRGILSGSDVIDHICRNKLCVNPDHLRAVTRAINTTENSTSPSALNKLKTHCPAGHEYTETNTRRDGSKRHCRACERARYHRLRAALDAARGEDNG